MTQQKKNWRVRVIRRIRDGVGPSWVWQVLLALPNYDIYCGTPYYTKAEANLYASVIRRNMKQVRQEVRL